MTTSQKRTKVLNSTKKRDDGGMGFQNSTKLRDVIN